MTIEHRPREIQLTSKQLVFVFMSTVLAAVVVFLLGVWVGRGIGVDSLAASEGTDVAVSPRTNPAEPNGASGTPPSGAGEAPSAPLTYPGTLQGQGSGPNAQAGSQVQTPPPAPLASPPPATITPAPPEKAAAPPQEKPPAPPREKPTAATAKPAPNAESYAVQVGAFSAKAGAEKFAADYRAKGYSVSVTPGPTFRVWLGPYPKKAEADQVASRVGKEVRNPSVIKLR